MKCCEMFHCIILSVQPFIHPIHTHLSILPSIHPPMHPSIHPLLQLSIHPSTHATDTIPSLVPGASWTGGSILLSLTTASIPNQGAIELWGPEWIWRKSRNQVGFEGIWGALEGGEGVTHRGPGGKGTRSWPLAWMEAPWAVG